MFNYNTDRYSRKQNDFLSDILMDLVKDGFADYIDEDIVKQEEENIEKFMRDYTYEDYMADAMHYLDKAYEYLGVPKKISTNVPVQPRYNKTEYKPECKPVFKPKAACSCGNTCECKSEKTSSLRLPKITRVIFNNPDTTVFFDDGTISHVKTVKGDKFDKEHGILYAVFKRLYGNHGAREGMRGLMPGSGASILLQRLVNGAEDIKKKKVVSKQKPDAPVETPNEEAPPPSVFYNI